MMILSIILIWMAFAYGNIPLARWHAGIIARAIAAKKKTAILHALWAAGYAAASFIPMIPHWSQAKWLSAFLGLSFAMLHASVFPVFLNRYRGFADFNLSHTSTAFFDQLQCKLGFKTSKAVNVGAFFLSIIFLGIYIYLYLIKK